MRRGVQVRVPVQPGQPRGRRLEPPLLLPLRPPVHHGAPDPAHRLQLAHTRWVESSSSVTSILLYSNQYCGFHIKHI